MPVITSDRQFRISASFTLESLNADEQFEECQVFRCQMFLEFLAVAFDKCLSHNVSDIHRQVCESFHPKTEHVLHNTEAAAKSSQQFHVVVVGRAPLETRSPHSPSAKCIAARLWYWKILITSKSIVYVACALNSTRTLNVNANKKGDRVSY